MTRKVEEQRAEDLKWGGQSAAAGSQAAKTPSRPPPAATEDISGLDPLAVWRSHLTARQERADWTDGVHPDCARLHQSLFGWRHDRPKDWSWPT